MTPLITFMSKLVAEPETSTWFDIGNVGKPLNGVVFHDYKVSNLSESKAP
jgi:hypothetical protein